ncbi:hypothetical protein B566_EDAN013077 [Ephemera danica]|nr:hypothetical protein B566_EDAN013077 [Ephemera danica]
MSWWCTWPLLLMAVNAESVYWSTLAPYSAINCKPEFGKQRCGGWNTTDLKRSVVNRGIITHGHFFQPNATRLHLPVSLLVRDEIKSNAASECRELKRNRIVSSKTTITNNPNNDGCDDGWYGTKCSTPGMQIKIPMKI